MILELKGVEHTLILDGVPQSGLGKRTIGMNDDFSEPYTWKSWQGMGKVIEQKTGKESVFCFQTNSRSSHIASVAWKRDNYSQWDGSLADFVFQTEFLSEESSKPIIIPDREVFIDFLCEEILKSEQKPFLKYNFPPQNVEVLIKKGLIAEFETGQTQIAL